MPSTGRPPSRPGLSRGLLPVRSRGNAMPANTAQLLCNGNAMGAGAANVLRLAVSPCNKLLSHRSDQIQAVIPFQGIQDAAGNAKGHLRVVRYLAGLQVQPAAADHVGNAAVCVADLPVAHKFQGAAQGASPTATPYRAPRIRSSCFSLIFFISVPPHAWTAGSKPWAFMFFAQAVTMAARSFFMAG